MKPFIISFFCFFLVFTSVNAQEGKSLSASEKKNQAELFFKKQQFITSRYYYVQAFYAYANHNDIQQAIACGLKAKDLYHKDHLYQMELQLCDKMDQQIYKAESRTEKDYSTLHFKVLLNKMQVYMITKKKNLADVTLKALNYLSLKAHNKELNNELVLNTIGYYYTFGNEKAGNTELEKMIFQYKVNKEYEKANERYEQVITFARKANNTTLLNHTFQKYIVWKDSVSSWTHHEKMTQLNIKYQKSLNTIETKDSSLTTKNIFIYGLLLIVAGLVIAFLFLGGLFFHKQRHYHQLKKDIDLTNKKLIYKNQFLDNFFNLLNPVIKSLKETTQHLGSDYTSEKNELNAKYDSMMKFTKDLHLYVDLEQTLSEKYPLKDEKTNLFCEEIMASISNDINPNITTSVNAPKISIKMNRDKMSVVLTYLLKMAAKNSTEGYLTLDFKKRSVHKYEILLSASGYNLPIKKKEHLFEAFSNTTNITEDEGLGFPICALMVNKMKGTITTDKNFKKGTRFILTFAI